MTKNIFIFFLLFSWLCRSQNVTTYTGKIPGLVDGDIKEARFSAPTGLLLHHGNLYVAEPIRANAVRKINFKTSTVTTIAGALEVGFVNAKGTSARFFHPTYLTADDDNNIYVTDFGNHAIRKIDPEGNVTTFAGGNDTGYIDGPRLMAKFNSPEGILYYKGDLYIADYHNNLIRKISLATGIVSTFAGTRGEGFKNGPALSAKFNAACNFCFDKKGNFFIADRLNHKIRKIDTLGNVSTYAGSSRGYKDGFVLEAQFDQPVGIDIDSIGNMYVVDMYNHKIRKIDPKGNVSTIAGSTVGFVDGIGEEAKFNYPTDLKVDNKGNIYVSDHYNGSIRKITFETPFWRQWWFKSLEVTCVILLLVLIIILIYNNKLKIEKKKNLQLIQNLELKITALKAQMNPHFIFNSLNSIQKFILAEDNENAFKYLSTFSELVRQILESNTAENILLSDELILINKYIEMESLRFKNSFKFNLKIDKKITPSIIKIPHMMVQPFIETPYDNCFTKKEKKELSPLIFMFRRSTLTVRGGR